MSKQSQEESFDAWIDHVFNHEVRDPAWYWDKGVEYLELSPETSVRFLTRLFNNATALLEPFSKAQINQGLWFIMSASDYHDGMFDASVQWSVRKECIQSIYHLFADFFERECAPFLSTEDNTDNHHKSPLNMSCHMFWDLCRFNYNVRDTYVNDSNEACLQVMQKTLCLKNIACQEAALHGLGHLYEQCPDRVRSIIQDFLKQNPYISDKLVHYANRAAEGNIL